MSYGITSYINHGLTTTLFQDVNNNSFRHISLDMTHGMRVSVVIFELQVVCVPITLDVFIDDSRAIF